jgi:hypothetical protein
LFKGFYDFTIPYQTHDRCNPINPSGTMNVFRKIC